MTHGHPQGMDAPVSPAHNSCNNPSTRGRGIRNGLLGNADETTSGKPAAPYPRNSGGCSVSVTWGAGSVLQPLLAASI
jgi:hypothetical protein